MNKIIIGAALLLGSWLFLRKKEASNETKETKEATQGSVSGSSITASSNTKPATDFVPSPTNNSATDRRFVSMAYKGQTYAIPTDESERKQMANELFKKAEQMALSIQQGEQTFTREQVLKTTNLAQWIISLTNQMLMSQGANNVDNTANAASADDVNNAAFAFAGQPNLERIRKRRNLKPRVVSTL